MSDYYITGDESDCMFKWMEEHDKVCPFAYKNTTDRFKYSETTKENMCIVRVTCECGEVKMVTICCKE